MSLSNLPEPNHFTLEQLCERWCCDEEALLQYCRSDMLEIGVMINGFDAFFYDGDCNEVFVELNGFYALSISDVDRASFVSPCRVKEVYLSSNSDYFIWDGKECSLYLNKIILHKDYVFLSDELVVERIERDKFESLHKIDVNNLDKANSEIPLALTVQERRGLTLNDWFADNKINTKEPLEYTQQEIWNLLGEVAPDLFRASSKDTVKDFFKNQNLCSFKTGRRKGGD